MKAKLWKLTVCNGVLEMTHGWGQEILEIEIPEYNISINVGNGEANYFKTYEERYNKASFVRDIDFPEDIAKGFNELLILEESLEEKLLEIFSEIELTDTESPESNKP